MASKDTILFAPLPPPTCPDCGRPKGTPAQLRASCEAAHQGHPDPYVKVCYTTGGASCKALVQVKKPSRS